MARCGSYPLMNLAEDFGVDYGDVLVWAGYLRASRIDRRVSHGGYEQLLDALIRIVERIGGARQVELMHKMSEHADHRWGPGPRFYA